MNNPESIEIIDRFYRAFDEVKTKGLIRFKNDFITAHGIHRSSFYDAKRKMESDRFQLSWIAFLVNDFGISAEWIMTGKGKMFKK